MNNFGAQKTLSAYLVGLGACILLTLAAFVSVTHHLFSNSMLYVCLAALAITQLVVQCVCFLRLNTQKDGRDNLMSFLFVILIIAILAGGSLWIMYNLNANM